MSTGRMIGGVITFLATFIFVLYALQAYHLYVTQPKLPVHYNTTRLDIIESKKENQDQSFQQVAQGAQHRITHTIKDNQVCIGTNNCHSIHNIGAEVSSFETKDYVVLHNPTHFMVYAKTKKDSQLHFDSFISPKAIHFKYSRNPTYTTFSNTNNLFVYESKSLYAVYTISQDSIQQCLFLEKLSSNYTQHILAPSKQHSIVLLSFPRRSQIMLQTYSCITKKLEKINKIAVEGWIKQYKFKSNSTTLQIKITKETGHADYQISLQTLKVLSVVEEQDKHVVVDNNINQLSFSRSFSAKYAVQKLIEAVPQQLEATRNYFISNQASQYNDEFLASFKKSQTKKSISFFDANRIVSIDFKNSSGSVLSLGTHLIKTQTPVFHNFENCTLQYFLDATSKPQTIRYIQDGTIHQADYLGVLEVYPKTADTQWMGFTKSLIDYFPRNPTAREYKFARSGDTVIVIQGTNLKGRFKLPYNKYESYQTLKSQPMRIKSELTQSHRVYVSLICVWEVNKFGNVNVVKLVNGYNGKVQKSFELGNIAPEDIYTYLEDNQFILGVYDRTKKATVFSKVQGYVDMSLRDQHYPFWTVTREYEVPHRLVKVHKTNSNEYLFVTKANQQLYFAKLQRAVLSNRRPLSAEVKLSNIESLVVDKGLPEFKNKAVFDDAFWLTLKTDQVYQSDSLQIVELSSDYSFYSQQLYAILPRTSGNTYEVFNIAQLIERQQSQSLNYLKWVYVLLGLSLSPICLIFRWLFSGRTGNVSINKAQVQTTTPEPSKKQQIKTGQVSKRKKKKQ